MIQFASHLESGWLSFAVLAKFTLTQNSFFLCNLKKQLLLIIGMFYIKLVRCITNEQIDVECKIYFQRLVVI